MYLILAIRLNIDAIELIFAKQIAFANEILCMGTIKNIGLYYRKLKTILVYKF